MLVNYTIEGKCPEGCSQCCTSCLPINKAEIDKIKRYIRIHHIEPENYNANQNIFTPEYVDVCPFVNKETHKCNIYEVRPKVCSYFMCNGSDGKFKMEDRNIENFYSVFFPNIKLFAKPDVKKLDYMVKEGKKLIK